MCQKRHPILPWHQGALPPKTRLQLLKAWWLEYSPKLRLVVWLCSVFKLSRMGYCSHEDWNVVSETIKGALTLLEIYNSTSNPQICSPLQRQYYNIQLILNLKEMGIFWKYVLLIISHVVGGTSISIDFSTVLFCPEVPYIVIKFRCWLFCLYLSLLSFSIQCLSESFPAAWL